MSDEGDVYIIDPEEIRVRIFENLTFSQRPLGCTTEQAWEWAQATNLNASHISTLAAASAVNYICETLSDKIVRDGGGTRQ